MSLSFRPGQLHIHTRQLKREPYARVEKVKDIRIQSLECGHLMCRVSKLQSFLSLRY